VDAHLPRRLCGLLAQRGHDALHTLELSAGNAIRDRDINQISIEQQRVVILKDADFFYSHLLQGRPWKLMPVKTGNIATHDLCEVFEHNLAAIETALQNHTLEEIDRAAVSPVV
jgi:predicted nuclease of predicted toxin-antitoxin system